MMTPIQTVFALAQSGYVEPNPLDQTPSWPRPDSWLQRRRREIAAREIEATVKNQAKEGSET